MSVVLLVLVKKWPPYGLPCLILEVRAGLAEGKNYLAEGPRKLTEPPGCRGAESRSNNQILSSNCFLELYFLIVCLCLGWWGSWWARVGVGEAQEAGQTIKF